MLYVSSRLQGPLPSFCGNPSMQVAAFDSNLIEALPANFSCYGHIHTLQLNANPIRDVLPSDFWMQLRLLQDLFLSNTLLNGYAQQRCRVWQPRRWTVC